MAKLTPLIPLQISETDGAYRMIENYTGLVRQNLKILIFTNPGERLMDSNFGVGLKRFLFENASSGVTQSNIANRINSQVNTYLDYLSIANIDVVLTDQRIDVSLYYTIDPLGIADLLRVSFDMSEQR